MQTIKISALALAAAVALGAGSTAFAQQGLTNSAPAAPAAPETTTRALTPGEIDALKGGATLVSGRIELPDGVPVASGAMVRIECRTTAEGVAACTRNGEAISEAEAEAFRIALPPAGATGQVIRLQSRRQPE